MVADRGDRGAQPVGQPVAAAEREHRHGQPQLGTRFLAGEALGGEGSAIPFEARARGAGRREDPDIFVDRGRLDRIVARALGLPSASNKIWLL